MKNASSIGCQRITKALSRVVKRDREKGSAAVEFVVLAIPLFLPILIFLSQFSNVSRSEIQARNLVREVVRAYVSSTGESEAERNADAVLLLGQKRLAFTPTEVASMRLSMTCSERKCLTRGGRVRAEIQLVPDGTSRQVRVAAQEYVSPWR